jgi:hypothetical protein
MIYYSMKTNMDSSSSSSSISSIINEENTRNNISYGTPIIAFDFDTKHEDDFMLNRQQIIFLLIYTIIIPIVLFIISRIIRCLRRRGVISENSEECIFNECQRHLNRGAGIISFHQLPQQPPSNMLSSKYNTSSKHLPNLHFNAISRV